MNIIEIIDKKSKGKALSRKEIEYFVNGYTNGEIADYQASSLLMAIKLKGMNEKETIDLTRAMLYSGETNDLSSLPGVTVDKHSTGGVGDKTTIVLAPLVAACGLTIAKMSGRGLGHTGGTIDKLESIPGFDASLTNDEFFNQVKNIGIAVITHVILCLPHENTEKMLETISYLNKLPINGIKLQLLHILKGTDLEKVYTAEPFYLPDLEEYTKLLGDIISHLREDIVIHRLTGDGPKSLLIAPLWTGDKRVVLNRIQKYFKDADIWQGKEISCQNHLHSTN